MEATLIRALATAYLVIFLVLCINRGAQYMKHHPPGHGRDFDPDTDEWIKRHIKRLDRQYYVRVVSATGWQAFKGSLPLLFFLILLVLPLFLFPHA